VNGTGIEALKAAGLNVVLGESEAPARKLNEAYFKWVATGQPFLTLKYAMTLDGKIATGSGSSFWVTGVEARRFVARLRSQVDAILVGIGTVLADDPQLTARPGELGEPELEPAHQPLRVVLDSQARLPPTARLVAEAPERTLVCATDRAPFARLRELQERGVQTLLLPARGNRVDPAGVLQALGSREVISVLAECGGTLAASLLGAGHVDKVLAFVAPKIVGGVDAMSPVEGTGVEPMEAALELEDPEWIILGQDALCLGYLHGRSLDTSPGGEG
jgi:diaminohydroxyphosphoribosylaminopyrimidine deaminase/5-amino-6-(5-phosphoribosylamino)uracil reductase